MMTVNFGHARIRHRVDHFRAVFGNPIAFVCFPDHVAGDVLQEHERNVSLTTKLDEVCRFKRALGKQDTVIAEDAHGITLDAGEATDQAFDRTAL